MRRFVMSKVALVMMLASAVGVLCDGAVGQTDYAGRTMDSGAGLMAGMTAGSAPLSYLARYDSCVTFDLTPTITPSSSSWLGGVLTISYALSGFPVNGAIAQGQVVYVTTGSYSSSGAGELVQTGTSSGGTGTITLSFASNPGTVTSLGYCRSGAMVGESGAQMTFFGTPNSSGIGSPDAGYSMGNLIGSPAAVMNTQFQDADFGAYSVWATDHISTISSLGAPYPKAPIDASGGGFMYGTANDVPLIFENNNGTRYISHVIESRMLAMKTTPCTATNPCIVPSSVVEQSGCNPAGGCSPPSFPTTGCNAPGGLTKQCATTFSGPLVPSRNPSDIPNWFLEFYWGQAAYPWALQSWKCQLVSTMSGGYPTGINDYLRCSLWTNFQYDGSGLPGIGFDYNEQWSGTQFASVQDDVTLALGGGASYQAIGNGTGGAQTLTIDTFVMPVHNNVGGTSCPNGAHPSQAFAVNCSYVFQYIPPGCNIGDAYNCTATGTTTPATYSGGSYSCASGASGFTAPNDLSGIRPSYVPMCEPNWNLCPSQYYFSTTSGTSASITGISGTGSIVTVTSTLNPAVGTNVIISGVTPASYDGPYYVTSSSGTQFTVNSSVTGNYVSGGTASLWVGCKIPEANDASLGHGYWINVGKNNSQGPGFDVVNYSTSNGYSHWNTRTALVDRGYGVNGIGSNPMPSGQMYTDDAMMCNQLTGSNCAAGSGTPYGVLFTVHDTEQLLAHNYSNVSATGGNNQNCNYMTAQAIDPIDCSPQTNSAGSPANWPEMSGGPNGECTGTINATQTYWPAVWPWGGSWNWPAAMQWQSATNSGGTTVYTGSNKWAVDPNNHQMYATVQAVVNGNTIPSLDPTDWQPAPYYCNKHFPDWDESAPIRVGGNLVPGIRPVLLIGAPFGAGGGHSTEGQMYDNSGGNFYAHLFGQPNCGSSCPSLDGDPGHVGQPNPGTQLLYQNLPCDDHTVYDNANFNDTTPPYIGTSQVPYWAFDPDCGTGAPHAACPNGLSNAAMQTYCLGPGLTGTGANPDPICNGYVSSGYGEELFLNANPRNGKTWRLNHHAGSGSIGTYTGQNQWPTVSPDGLLAAVTTDAMNTRGDVNAQTSACQTPTRAMWANWTKNTCVLPNDVFMSKASGGPTYTLTSCGSTCTVGSVANAGCSMGATQPNWSSCTSKPCSMTDAAGNLWTYDGTNSCETDVFVTALPTSVPAP